MPMGWGNQLKNEPGVALFYERKWRRMRTPLPDMPLFEIDMTPHIGGSVGNVFTYGAVGATFRIGRDLGVDYGPPRIRPGLAGSLHVDPPLDRYAYYAFFGFEGRAVARDITLDGNTFARSHSVNRPAAGRRSANGRCGRGRAHSRHVQLRDAHARIRGSEQARPFRRAVDLVSLLADPVRVQHQGRTRQREGEGAQRHRHQALFQERRHDLRARRRQGPAP